MTAGSDIPATTAGALSPLQRALISWWAEHGRDLPWRRTRDPWAVLVSELMLQQTQVTRVLQRWERFLERFPTPASCAAASPGEVVDEWAGLGYNRRAVHLHRTATICVEDFGGRLPTTLGELQSLPGVGPYTARAVLVFALERDVGLVDTNAGRFVARALAGERLRPRDAQATADAHVPDAWGWTWGQLRSRRHRLHEAEPGLRARPDDPRRARRVAETLVVDGLALHADGEWRLP